MDSPLMERLAEIFKHTWDLGFTAFGGPPNHFQIFYSRFVEKYKWLDDQAYQETFALSQTLPGPASTKMLYTISLLRGGFPAAVLAFLLWSLPSALGMFGFSRGVSNIADTLPLGVYAFLSGLNSATVEIVAVAATQMSSRAIGKQDDGLLRAIVAFTASAGMLYKAIVLECRGWRGTCLSSRGVFHRGSGKRIVDSVPLSEASGEIFSAYIPLNSTY